jgi:tetratricopeptide (TPR) repeat protein
MTRPHPNKPNPAIQRLYREAEEAWDRQDYQKGISLFEQASRKEPYNPSILLDLARAHGRRYDFAAAEHCFEKAVQISKDRAHTLGEAGQVCLQFDNIDMAMGYFRRASQKKGVSVGVLVTLADMLGRDKRLDEAAEVVGHAAQIDRKDPRVQLEQALLVRLRGNLPDAESLLQDVLTNPAASASVRTRGLYELASILDATGRYDEAMTALLEAKAVMRPHAGPYVATLQHMQNRAKEMEQTLPTAVLDR